MWPVWADDEYLVGFVKFMQVKYFILYVIFIPLICTACIKKKTSSINIFKC